MPTNTRLSGEPVLRIVCKNTDALVGYLYLWNTGELQPAWLGDAMTEVRYAHMSQAAG